MRGAGAWCVVRGAVRCVVRCGCVVRGSAGCRGRVQGVVHNVTMSVTMSTMSTMSTILQYPVDKAETSTSPAPACTCPAPISKPSTSGVWRAGLLPEPVDDFAFPFHFPEPDILSSAETADLHQRLTRISSRNSLEKSCDVTIFESAHRAFPRSPFACNCRTSSTSP